MTILYTQDHQLHSPEYEVFNGERISHSEVPDRVENILKELRKTGYELRSVSKAFDEKNVLSVLSTIHDQRYLDWIRAVQPTEALYPGVFNFTDEVQINGHPSIQWGNFVTDTFTPLLPNTWRAALTMAQASCSAAELMLQGEKVFTVVGRPPGHHAGRSRVGGYCYVNNAAIAAQVLAESGRVAILDVDYHHGNGTQDIFYNRSDVVTCSIHADPVRKFPYFAGFSTEEGIEDGAGCNRNYPLPANISDDQYQPVLEEALEWLANHHPDFLIVSLGFDTHESDPIADFKLTTGYYQRMAQTISQLYLQTVIVLEGGYSTEAIGRNMASFLSGIT